MREPKEPKKRTPEDDIIYPHPRHCEGCGGVVNYPAQGCQDCEGNRCQECCPGVTAVVED